MGLPREVSLAASLSPDVIEKIIAGRTTGNCWMSSLGSSSRSDRACARMSQRSFFRPRTLSRAPRTGRVVAVARRTAATIERGANSGSTVAS